MNKFITSLITVLAVTGGISAQTINTHSPRLIIGITIDQLRQNYLQAFSQLYKEKGLKRLIKEGRFYSNAYYDFANPDEASSVASVYTGTAPVVNGIVGDRWFDRASLLERGCVDDIKYIGYNTNDETSPSNLLVTTFSDELKMSTSGKSLVISISPNRESAVLSAGHTGDLALWLNNSGRWCSSLYYQHFPNFVIDYNRNSSFSKSALNSPSVNDEVNNMLSSVLINEPLGLDETPDVLSLTYDGKNCTHLDKNISDLLDMIDRRIGLKNTLIFLTSTGTTAENENIDPKYKIPGGEFHIERCSALLNLYFNAKYGNGLYVMGYDGLQIYLNHKLIEDKGLTLRDITDHAIDFLREFSGVQNVYSPFSQLTSSVDPDFESLRKAYNRLHSGDLQISVLPGWTVVNKTNNSYNHTVRKAYISSPLIIFGANVEPATIKTPVCLDRVAPTICSSLQIRAPNGCKSTPLEDVFKIQNNY